MTIYFCKFLISKIWYTRRTVHKYLDVSKLLEMTQTIFQMKLHYRIWATNFVSVSRIQLVHIDENDN